MLDKGFRPSEESPTATGAVNLTGKNWPGLQDETFRGALAPYTAVTSYFVSVDGDDFNPGTETGPWRTLKHSISQLQPGDMLYVRGGKYRESNIKINQKGTEEKPIVIRNYPKESPILDMNFEEFTKVPNNEWELVDPEKHIYRSTQIYPASTGNYLNGKFESDGQIYSLNIYEQFESFASNNEYVTADGIRYVGPGLYWNSTENRFYVRLQPPSADAVLKKVTLLNSTDPRSNRLFIGSERYGIVFRNDAQHIHIEGIDIANFHTPIRIFSGEFISCRNMKINAGRYAFLIESDVHDLRIDEVKMNLFLPYWIACTDIWGATRIANSLRLIGIQISGAAHHIEVVNSEFNGVYDGIVTASTIGAHDLQINSNVFTVINEAVRLGSSTHEVEFAYNIVHGSGPSHHGSGSSKFPGTKYIHHNIFDTKKARTLWPT